MSVETGLSARVELVIGDADTALAAHTGDVPVLATPRVIALVEEAAVSAVSGRLEHGETTVSMRVQVDHVSPAPVGDLVVATAKLEKIEGRKLIFSVSVTDPRGLVAAGKVTRVIVDRGRFLDKCR